MNKFKQNLELDAQLLFSVYLSYWMNHDIGKVYFLKVMKDFSIPTGGAIKRLWWLSGQSKRYAIKVSKRAFELQLAFLKDMDENEV